MRGRLRGLPVAAAVLVTAGTLGGQDSRQATGVKIGEVTPHSAVVWMRVTREAERNWKGISLRGKGGDRTVPDNVSIDQLEGAAPGAPGQARFRYATQPGLNGARSTPWMKVSADRDFSIQFEISGLKPHTRYHYSADTAGPDGTPRHGSLRGTFRTAPLPDAAVDVTFTVITGMMYADLDDREGFRIYDAMRRLRPDLLIPTGDTVYYDNEDPRVTSTAVARYHWDRMYSLPKLIAFHLEVPACWEKDDHDVYHDDCWPAMRMERMGGFTFRDGQRVFLEKVPLNGPPFRRVRWGKRLEVWLVEGRDFRSPNDAPDGPGKSIWGEKQKAWLKRTLLESDAEWKVLVSPTPIVGPDRSRKADNHSNLAFAHEGREMRAWFAENLPGNFFVACGDRHWQYHSVDPETGVQEFSSGPASDEHAGGSPGQDPEFHRFHRVKGGFLSISVSGDGIAFRHHDVNGRIVYEYRR